MPDPAGIVVSRKPEPSINDPASLLPPNPQQTLPDGLTPQGAESLTHYYGAEQGGLVDKLPTEMRERVEEMRAGGQLPPAGVDNLNAYFNGTWKPKDLLNLPEGTSTTVTPTSQYGQMAVNDTARNVGGLTGGMAGAAAGARFGRPLGLIGEIPAAIAGAFIGGFGGGAGGEATQPGGALLPRMQNAGAEQGTQSAYGEAGGQFVMRPAFAALSKLGGHLLGMTPTGGLMEKLGIATKNATGDAVKSAEEAYVDTLAKAQAQHAADTEARNATIAQNAAGQIGNAAQMQAARTAAPGVSAQADYAINAATGASQEAAAQAESALPRGVKLRSDRLEGPPPVTPPPRVSPIVDEYGKPIVTQPRAKVLRKLTENDIPDASMIPRRQLETQGQLAEQTAATLKGIRDSSGAVKTVQTLAKNPDAIQQLYQLADPDERALLDVAVAAGERNMAKALPIPSVGPFTAPPKPDMGPIIDAARQAVQNKFANMPGHWDRTAIAALTAASFAAGHSHSGPTGVAWGIAATAILSPLLDKFFNHVAQYPIAAVANAATSRPVAHALARAQSMNVPAPPAFLQAQPPQ